MSKQRLGLVVLLFALVYLHKTAPLMRIELVSDSNGNEALILDARLSGRQRTLFLLDTAYAGAPVLSSSFLSVQHLCARGTTQARYRSCLSLSKNVDVRRRASSIHSVLLERRRCQAFTSGCTMRLMGIGDISESRADMLLCPSLQLKRRDGAWCAASTSTDADIFVTHELPGAPHILTSDYLLHRAPCILCPAKGTLQFFAFEGASVQKSFEFQPANFVSGAIVVPMIVGEARLEIVVDTGAAVPLSLSPGAVKKVKKCERPKEPQRVTQVGVNGERVCSDVLLATVQIGKLNLGTVNVFANTHDVAGADGYAGMGLLRALDMWIDPSRIGFRRSGLPTRTPMTTPGSCGKDSFQCEA